MNLNSKESSEWVWTMNMKHFKNAKLVKCRRVCSTLIMKSFFISRYTQHKHHNPRISYRFHSAAIWIRIIFYEQKLRTRYVITQQQLLVVAKEIVFIKDSKTTNNDTDKKCSSFLNERMCLAYNYLLHIFGIHVDLRIEYAWICLRNETCATNYEHRSTRRKKVNVAGATKV